MTKPYNYLLEGRGLRMVIVFFYYYLKLKPPNVFDYTASLRLADPEPRPKTKLKDPKYYFFIRLMND